VLFHGRQLFIHPEFESFFKAHSLATPEDVIRTWVKEPPDPARRSRVVELRLPHAGVTAHLFLKTYDYAWPDRFRTLFVPARVKREFRNLQGLSKLGMSVPQPIAYGQTRSMGFVTCSFVLTKAIENAIDLRELADRKPAPFPLPSRRERRALITTFARRLRRCHDDGWFIHTAFFKNLLLTKGYSGYEIHLIDVPFARIWRNRLRPEAGRLRDFACLAKGAAGFLTPGEQMAFYLAYRANSEKLEPSEKEFLRRVTIEARSF